MITIDMIMNTQPCVRWPRAKVEAALARADRSSWAALVHSARADEWLTCSLADMRLMLCQYAARYHRADVLTPWVVRVTHLRVALQCLRWPAGPSTVAIRDRLCRWRGDREEIANIRSDAYAAAYAAADNNDANATAATYAADAAFSAAYATFPFADAYVAGVAAANAAADAQAAARAAVEVATDASCFAHAGRRAGDVAAAAAAAAAASEAAAFLALLGLAHHLDEVAS